MTVTLELPPNVQERVQAEAARQSMRVEDYLLDLVSRTLPATDEALRARSLALLAHVDDLGDEAEQHETFEHLKSEIDSHPLSDRKRF